MNLMHIINLTLIYVKVKKVEIIKQTTLNIIIILLKTM